MIRGPIAQGILEQGRLALRIQVLKKNMLVRPTLPEETTEAVYEGGQALI